MSELIRHIDDYYTQKLKEFGATAKGVDWNSDESQHLRFDKLLSVIEPSNSFSVLDYGCGFGSMFNYMKGKFGKFDYTGYDISAAMISEAKKLIHDTNAVWVSELSKGKKFDYVIASGIFNVRLQQTDDEWQAYMQQTVDQLHEISERGFSFNVLSSYSDVDKRRGYLYYADPLYWFDYCKRRHSYKVALLHDYPLYEFTLHVKK